MQVNSRPHVDVMRRSHSRGSGDRTRCIDSYGLGHFVQKISGGFLFEISVRCLLAEFANNVSYDYYFDSSKNNCDLLSQTANPNFVESAPNCATLTPQLTSSQPLEG